MLKLLAKYLQLLAQSFRLAHLPELYRVRGGAVDSDTALQAGRSRVVFPVVLLEMFIDLFIAAAFMSLESTQSLTEMSTMNISWG
jgi:hypothetical protein